MKNQHTVRSVKEQSTQNVRALEFGSERCCIESEPDRALGSNGAILVWNVCCTGYDSEVTARPFDLV